MKGLYLVWALVVTIGVLISGLGSAVYMYEKRVIIQNKLSPYAPKVIGSDKVIKGTKEDEFWAKEILNGGYILHFRHAEREKWTDIEAYDSLESDILQIKEKGERKAEASYFDKAVCLNTRGKVQARMMMEHIGNIKLPVSHVITSTSCRSRETANIAFGGYDSEHRLLVHNGPYWQSYTDRVDELRDFYLGLPISTEGNTVVSAHNSVVMAEMFEQVPEVELTLEEGGFYVISNKDGNLNVEHRFYGFQDLTRIFYKR